MNKSTVLKEMALALDAEKRDLDAEVDRGYSSFRVGQVYRVTFGSKEYCVAEDDDVVHALAIAIVTQDLEEEPENFNRNFLEHHIDKAQLRKELEDDVENSLYDLYGEEPDRVWEDREREGLDVPEEDEDGERRDPNTKEVDELVDLLAVEQLREPIAYLEEIYSKEEALQKALELGGIDIEAAAEEAVGADGEGHFVARYDGDIHQTPGGLSFWRAQ